MRLYSIEPCALPKTMCDSDEQPIVIIIIIIIIIYR